MEKYLGDPLMVSPEEYFDLAEIDTDLHKGLRSAFRNEELFELKQKHFSKESKFSYYIEQEFTINGLYLGYMDLLCLEGSKVSIRDHKFTSAKRWIPKYDVLKKDPQTIIYSKAVLEFFNLENVEFNYDYYGSKTKFYQNTKINLTRDEINANWLNIVKDTLPLVENYLIPTGDKTRPNYLACREYGGCEFSTHCFGETK